MRDYRLNYNNFGIVCECSEDITTDKRKIAVFAVTVQPLSFDALSSEPLEYLYKPLITRN